MIKDSGERRVFESGAQRDCAEGRGRCDLLPLDVVSSIMNDYILNQIASFYQAEETFQTEKTFYLIDALKYFSSERYPDVPTMILEVSKHFEEGARKYGEYNWQKGIPVNCYIDSAVRHYLKWLRGDTDEPHDRAFVWNVLCCIWEIRHHESENTSEVN